MKKHRIFVAVFVSLIGSPIPNTYSYSNRAQVRLEVVPPSYGVYLDSSFVVAS